MHKAMTKNTYFPRLWVSAKNADMLKPGLPWGLREQSLSFERARRHYCYNTGNDSHDTQL